jgi:hypothetical protein
MIANAFGHRSEGADSAVLLVGATAVAVLSFLFHMITRQSSLLSEAVWGYFPVLLGSVSMWLCFKARKEAIHKGFVLLYAILLAPFAFSYPAWLLILWALYASGRYHGPMP